MVVSGPEARSVFQSGLTEAIAAAGGRPLVLTRNPRSQGVPSSLPAEALPFPYEVPWLSRYRQRVRALRQRWLASQGQRLWRHRPPTGRAPTAPLSPPLSLVELASTMERSLSNRFGGHPDWEDSLARLGIGAIVCTSLGSPRSLPPLASARKMGIPIHIAPNSWKDQFINPHLHIWPDKLMLWNQTQADAIKHSNPRLPARRVEVTGSLHLEALHRVDAVPRSEFLKRSALDPARPYFCYTAASTSAVENEEAIIETVLGALATIPERPQLVLRANPMGERERFLALQGRFPRDLVVQQPQWEWDPILDWCSPLPEDLENWRSTIYHSTANISIPSTVTLEFLAMNRPVINITFDAESGPNSHSNQRYWDAPFYADLRSNPLVHPVGKETGLAAVLRSILANNTGPTGHPLPRPDLARLAARITRNLHSDSPRRLDLDLGN